MALVYQETRAEAVCSLEQDVLVLLNDKSRMKGDLHVRFREKFEVKVLLLTRLRGRRLTTASYSIYIIYVSDFHRILSVEAGFAYRQPLDHLVQIFQFQISE